MATDKCTPAETTDAWIGRMRGFISIFVSILLTKSPHSNLPYDLGLVWALLSSLLNLTTFHPWVPFLFVTILDVGSSVLYSAFQNEYLKLVFVIKNKLLPILKCSSTQFSPKSSLPRLEIIVDEILSNPTTIGLLF